MWQKMVSLGWTGIPFPEEYGGCGGSVIDQAMIINELSRGLFVSGFVYLLITCFGGQGIGMLTKTLVVEEMSSKCLVEFSHHAFTLPPDTPNLYYLNECCNAAQREKYFGPYSAMTKPIRPWLSPNFFHPDCGSRRGSVGQEPVRGSPDRAGFTLHRHGGTTDSDQFAKTQNNAVILPNRNKQ